jgi:hypothetical protein
LQTLFPVGPTIHVPARLVTRHALPPFSGWGGRFGTLPVALMRKRLVFGGDWDLAAHDCADMLSFRRVASLVAHASAYRDSLWYDAARRSFEKHGYFRHKTRFARSIAEIDALFEDELVPLVVTMRDEGYRQRPGSDIPLALISRSGEVLKTEKGRHRFAAAQALGLEDFPLRIAAVHRDWLRGEGIGGGPGTRGRIFGLIRALEQDLRGKKPL